MLKPKKQFILHLAILAVFAILLTVPMFSHAAGLVPCGGDAPEKPCTVLDAFYMIARVTNWLILMAGIFAVYEIVGAGFWLVASAGEEESITKRKKALSSAVVGFFLVMAAYMFMNTVVNFILMSKCTIDFRSPWTYLTVADPHNPASGCSNVNNTFLKPPATPPATPPTN